LDDTPGRISEPAGLRARGDRVILRRDNPKPESILDGETLVVCTEALRPAYISRLIQRGEWLRFDSPVVQANRGHFAVPLNALEEVT
jgi:hypothetical protein